MRFITLACVTLLLLPSPADARDTRTWRRVSDVGRDALVAVALGVPIARRDGDGALEAAASMGGAFLIAQGLKETFPERRPDGSDRRSFPSGHAASAFAAAATLQNRYGWRVGLPAQAVAALVGFSRVEARKHHWYDVVAGAAIGETSGFLITRKRDDRVRVMPWGDTSGGGASLAVRF